MSNTLADRIVSAIDRALTPPSPDAVTVLARRVAKESGDKLASAEEVATLHDLQAEYGRLTPMLARYNRVAAMTDHEQSMKDNAAAIGRGEQPADCWTLDEYFSDYSHRTRAIESALCDVTRRALPICRTILARFAKAANTVAKDVEKDIAAIYRRLGQEPGPCELAGRIRALPDLLAKRVCDDVRGSTSPSWMCPFFDLN